MAPPGRRLAEYVESGGALLVVGGRAGFNGAYARSPVARVLPVLCSPDASTYREASLRLEVSRSGTLHPILRVSDDPLSDRRAWNDLPPLLACNLNEGLRPNAEALIFHPVERAGREKMPLVAVGRAGAGKVDGRDVQDVLASRSHDVGRRQERQGLEGVLGELGAVGC